MLTHALLPPTSFNFTFDLLTGMTVDDGDGPGGCHKIRLSNDRQILPKEFCLSLYINIFSFGIKHPFFRLI